MNGRLFFKRFFFIASALSKIFKILPSFLVWFLWDILSPFRGKTAVLSRYCIMAGRAKTFGVNIYMGRSVCLKNVEHLSIGDNVSIHDACYLDALGGLEIGNNVSIAHHTSILTFNHTWEDASLPIKYNPVQTAPVIINDDVWVGCGVRIMPGVTIGTRSVIAAGSVVTRDVPPGVIVAGVPAKVIKSIL